MKITTGLPRGNGQVERANRTLIPLLTKLAAPTGENWYKHVDLAQKWLNMTPSRSTGKSPFQLLFGVKMRSKYDLNIQQLIEEESVERFEVGRNELREEAKLQISRVQDENKRNHDKRHKDSHKYHEGDWVAIKRTQFGPGLKIKPKFLGPYEITRILRNDRYAVVRVGEHEGPRVTSTSADMLKLWSTPEVI